MKIHIKLRRPKSLPSPSPSQVEKIVALREKAKSLTIDTQNTTDTWVEAQNNILSSILNKDPRSFLHWDIITKTMFFEAHHLAWFDLKKSEFYKSNKALIKEDEPGNPPAYFLNRESSGNLIHHTYILSLIHSIIKLDVNRINIILEFGGGYGSFCRLLTRSGFKGTYQIFDLPLFGLLQEYFLSSTFPSKNIHTNGAKPSEGDSIILTQKINDIIPPDLFLAMWSLSECPIDLRMSVISKMKNPSYIIIAYQAKFGKMDNIAYFQQLRESMPDHIWNEIEIKTLPNNFLLIGSKN